MERMTKEREAEIRRDVADGRWGTARVKRDPSLVRLWYGKSDTVDGLVFSMWLDSTLAPERIEQLVRRAEMAAELLAEVDALRAEVERLRAASGAVVRVASDGTVEVHGPALVDLAEALLPRVRPTEPVEVDEDVIGDLPRAPVMP